MNRTELCLELASMTMPSCSVAFHSADAVLNRLMAKAERLAFANIQQFCPAMKSLIEGGGYSSVYTETQPMGGEMYAKRDVRLGLNNQLLFMLCQRSDGRLPGRVISTSQQDLHGWKEDPVYMYSSGKWESLGLLADYGQLQGNYLPYPAYKMYFLAGKPAGYLEMLAETVEAFDSYLWRTRDPDNEGVLQTWCVWDTGEDNSYRFGGSPNRWPHDYPPTGENTPKQDDPGDITRYYQWCTERELTESIKVPIRSMDMMAYSFENRMTRSLISEEIGDGMAQYWRDKAEEVRQLLLTHLWRAEKGAAFDKDRNNQWMDTLIHNNLRCMYFGIFTQDMADEFIERHLLNPDEFLTPVSLPSIAANDPLFRNISDNNWGGQVQGLTWQRSIRALENYERYAELTMLGRKFLQAIKVSGVLTQQYDPFDAEDPAKDNKGRDGYGPTVLAYMEFIAKFFGVHMERDIVMWSGLTDAGELQYAQELGDRTYLLRNDTRVVSGVVNGETAFTCSTGVRISSDLEGHPKTIVGIDTIPHMVTLRTNSIDITVEVLPNQIWTVNEGGVSLSSDRPTLLPRAS